METLREQKKRLDASNENISDEEIKTFSTKPIKKWITITLLVCVMGAIVCIFAYPHIENYAFSNYSEDKIVSSDT